MSYKIAGIDVHKKVLMVVVIDASMPESKPERRRFATMPSDLRRLLTWLREQGVEEAVMESTAQYWRSVWLELEPYMRLQLARGIGRRSGFMKPKSLEKLPIQRCTGFGSSINWQSRAKPVHEEAVTEWMFNPRVGVC
jgi:hypothetical protein